MKKWLNRALALLMGSLEAPRHEINELDWKAALSSDKKRLAEHLSALSNYPGGGFLVYGVDKSGSPVGIADAEMEVGIKQTANLFRTRYLLLRLLSRQIDRAVTEETI